jgi:hypothetical protein
VRLLHLLIQLLTFFGESLGDVLSSSKRIGERRRSKIKRETETERDRVGSSNRPQVGLCGFF